MIIIRPFLKTIVLASVLAAAAVPAMAQITINIGVAPPPAQYETVPVLAPAQVWAPGYWAWSGDRHVWVRGRAIYKRGGYRWTPDNWVQTGNGYSRQPGYWVRDTNYVVVKEKKAKKYKYKDDHDNNRSKKHGKNHGHKD
ncbi:hypothetical protein [Polaromonas sp.]|uniref:hypothetical protein n=1 Tax=Polaromonas sp. TaxID=1869339 RepID=UPI0035646FF1